MKIDVKQLKEQLTLSDYEKIINELDIPITQRDDKTWRLKSMCHAKTPDECDSNLVFYLDSRTFTCFSHGCLTWGDIFELIQIRQNLLGNDFTFIDSLNFVLDICDIEPHDIKQSTSYPKSWQSIVSRYRNDEYVDMEVEPYDDKVLHGFPKLYYQGWIDEGISIESMRKYEISYYPTKGAIVIPCRCIKGGLVGIRGRYLYGDQGKYRPIKLLDGTIYKFPTNQFFYGEFQNQNAIKKSGKAILVEGEKSVLKSDTWFGNDSVALALYGGAISSAKIRTLLELNVNEIIIGIDYDYHTLGDHDSYEYKKKVLKLHDKLKTYFNVSVLFNDKYDGYKFSPFDFTKEQYKTLYKERINL